jgi:large subunit ribosomal protein L13
MRTYTATPSDIEHRWYIVDADGMVLGRLASEIARVIRGKHKPMFTPHMDTGDYVIVINAAKVKLTGRKLEQKRYFRHTGYMGHERYTPVASMLAKHPERVIEKAVYGMLPKTALGRQELRRKLRVFSGTEHPHVAQQPIPLPTNKLTKIATSGETELAHAR